MAKSDKPRRRPRHPHGTNQLRPTVEKVLHLAEFSLGELQSKGGILDNLDYRRVRRLGVTLRNIPRPRPGDWDLPLYKVG
jgi:hypothetical protein